MPSRSSYAEGTPNWVDLQSTDPEAAKTFYGQLFGWQFTDIPVSETDVYSMAAKGDSPVAAISGQNPSMKAAGVPSMWNTYFAVDDADAATAKVAPAGGQVMMEPFEVMGAGKMAYVLDPTGAGFALWQAKDHVGAALVNEPGTLIWNELVTADADKALPFYTAVLGLEPETVEMGEAPYTTLKANGEMVGGTMAPQMEGVPNHWHVYFAVEDTDKAVARVTELGGDVIAGPFDTPIGPMAVLADPTGAMFSIFAPAGETK